MGDVSDREMEAAVDDAIEEGQLGGTPSEVRALEMAYFRGRESAVSQDTRMMALLLAIVRKDGRALVSRKQLDAIARGGGGRLDSKVLPSGDIVLTYLGPRGA